MESTVCVYVYAWQGEKVIIETYFWFLHPFLCVWLSRLCKSLFHVAVGGVFQAMLSHESCPFFICPVRSAPNISFISLSLHSSIFFLFTCDFFPHCSLLLLSIFKFHICLIPVFLSFPFLFCLFLFLLLFCALSMHRCGFVLVKIVVCRQWMRF